MPCRVGAGRDAGRRLGRREAGTRRPAAAPTRPGPPASAPHRMFPVWPERVATGLRPHGEAVRAAADRDPRDQPTVPGVEPVDHAVVAPGQPQHPAVGRDPAHVGAATAGDRPGVDDPVRREVEHADLAGAAVGDVEALPVAARVDPVRHPGHPDHADLPEGPGVDRAGARWCPCRRRRTSCRPVRSARPAARSGPSSWGRRAARSACGSRWSDAEHPVPQRRDLEQLPGELAGHHEEPAVAGEVGVVGAAAARVRQVLDGAEACARRRTGSCRTARSSPPPSCRRA